MSTPRIPSGKLRAVVVIALVALAICAGIYAHFWNILKSDYLDPCRFEGIRTVNVTGCYVTYSLQVGVSTLPLYLIVFGFLMLFTERDGLEE